jgi:hypothetical protein
MKQSFYDGTKLLSLKDINGEKPEIYMCTSNRSAGKTTYFNRLCVNRFIKYKEKFCVLYRFNYELADCADKFFKDVGGLFFPDYYMTSKNRAKGVYHELYLNEEPCGYAITINAADSVKKMSHLFSDTVRMIFDEFQSETNHYCPDEVNKFISIHTSIARGAGKQSRYVPVFMISNPVTLLNPYYTQMEISDRLTEKTKFLRGNGFVLEQGYNEAASNAQKESAFNRAFNKSNYMLYNAEGTYLNDNRAFVEKMTGSSRYICTIKYNDNNYGIREFVDSGIVYCDDKPDMTYPTKITVTTADHEINYIMLKRNDLFLTGLRFYFEKGCFRFKNIRCKEAVLKCLTY